MLFYSNPSLNGTNPPIKPTVIQPNPSQRYVPANLIHDLPTIPVQQRSTNTVLPHSFGISADFNAIVDILMMEFNL